MRSNMGSTKMELNQAVRSVGAETVQEDREEALAKVEIWRYVYGFVEIAVVSCAVELGIPDLLEGRDQPVPLEDLASATGSDPQLLSRVMRFLINRRIFKEGPASSPGYVQTPLSRLLMKTRGGSQASLLQLMSSPAMMDPLQYLSRYLKGEVSLPFVGAHGVDLWGYGAAHREDCDLFRLAMACCARGTVPALIRAYPEVFEGVRSVVDVGGSDGTALRILVGACPWIHGINFDLPHVVSNAQKIHGVEHVGGDMFVHVPEADAAFIMWVLHDWEDDDCVRILTNCRQAVPPRTGKVIIVESVIAEEPDHGADKLNDAALMLDMCMMAYTNGGKERTLVEWKDILDRSGFASHSIKPIPGELRSVIVAYP
uniref:O-methyltransferase n=1 Tax=Kalanchoe fedtschenkoi TaxID=63787 RepID=A0A7N0UX78_KALFE